MDDYYECLEDVMQYLDQLVREHTAFESFDDLLNASGGYRPSLRCGVGISRFENELTIIADAYDKCQADRGDSRRAFRC